MRITFLLPQLQTLPQRRLFLFRLRLYQKAKLSKAFFPSLLRQMYPSPRTAPALSKRIPLSDSAPPVATTCIFKWRAKSRIYSASAVLVDTRRKM